MLRRIKGDRHVYIAWFLMGQPLIDMGCDEAIIDSSAKYTRKKTINDPYFAVVVGFLRSKTTDDSCL